MIRSIENMDQGSIFPLNHQAYIATKKHSLFGRNAVVFTALNAQTIKNPETINKANLVFLKIESDKTLIRGHKEFVKAHQNMKNSTFSIIDPQGVKKRLSNVEIDLLEQEHIDYLERALHSYFYELNQIKQKERENKKDQEIPLNSKPSLKIATFKKELDKTETETGKNSSTFPIEETLKRISKMEKEIEKTRLQKKKTEKDSIEKDSQAIERDKKLEEHSDFVRVEAKIRQDTD